MGQDTAGNQNGRRASSATGSPEPGRAPRLGGLGPLRVSLLEMSEHSCSSPGARHLAGFCSSHRAVSGAGRRHCVRGQRWKGHGGDENREQEEGTVSFYKASNGTKPTLATQV